MKNIKQKITVTREDFYEFRVKAKRNNKILRFWMEIYKSMTKELKEESKSKATVLNKQEQLGSKRQVIELYKFETYNSSEDMLLYLDNFEVEVRD